MNSELVAECVAKLCAAGTLVPIDDDKETYVLARDAATISLALLAEQFGEARSPDGADPRVAGLLGTLEHGPSRGARAHDARGPAGDAGGGGARAPAEPARIAGARRASSPRHRAAVLPSDRRRGRWGSSRRTGGRRRAAPAAAATPRGSRPPSRGVSPLAPIGTAVTSPASISAVIAQRGTTATPRPRATILVTASWWSISMATRGKTPASSRIFSTSWNMRLRRSQISSVSSARSAGSMRVRRRAGACARPPAPARRCRPRPGAASAGPPAAS